MDATSGAATDEASVRALVLRLDDFPDAGWQALRTDEEGSASTAGEALLDRCLGGALEGRVMAAVDSARFVRDASLAYSTALLLDGEGSAAEAFALVASAAFAECFSDAVSADVAVAPGGAQLLGTLTRAVEGVDGLEGDGGGRAVVHRTVFSGGTAGGVTSVQIDLVVLLAHRALVLVWLADAPDPFPDALRAHLVARLLARLRASAPAP